MPRIVTGSGVVADYDDRAAQLRRKNLSTASDRDIICRHATGVWAGRQLSACRQASTKTRFTNPTEESEFNGYWARNA
jgi:hypothetical protein